jgi:hypothetical protein
VPAGGWRDRKPVEPDERDEHRFVQRVHQVLWRHLTPHCSASIPAVGLRRCRIVRTVPPPLVVITRRTARHRASGVSLRRRVRDAAAYGGGVDAVATGDSTAEQKAYLLWVRQLARQMSVPPGNLTQMLRSGYRLSVVAVPQARTFAADPLQRHATVARASLTAQPVERSRRQRCLFESGVRASSRRIRSARRYVASACALVSPTW